MTNTDYINVWNHEVLYVNEVFSREQMIEQLGAAAHEAMSTESLAVTLAHVRIGENNAHRLIPAETMIREFLNR
jgi:hypothetical protein